MERRTWNSRQKPIPPLAENTVEHAPQSTHEVGRRLLIAAAVLAVGVAAEFALAAHLRHSGELSYPALTGSFDSLHKEADGRIVVRDPKTGQPEWLGQEMIEAREATRKKLPFKVADLLMRAYQNRDGAVAQLYMVYCLAGDDRQHHPEICVRDVNGAPEDMSFRREVPLTSDGSATAMRFRFRTGTSRSIVIYYWHYTPKPAVDPGQTILQAIHQRIGVSAPSVTAQLTVPGDDPKLLEAVERQLLPSLHARGHREIAAAGNGDRLRPAPGPPGPVNLGLKTTRVCKPKARTQRDTGPRTPSFNPA